ncbi:hypothetical protein GSI_09497 [Ganoderma sinense ZZ0214-1]|uniref:Uncharacterized protein n=1 Tax=Ganoderma sinense ZZ0214-1 TaxID=1077348 RepID=A0A2G8S3J3_9APHY|nr:hypothetical protein GSI_09497 [Ganoderma sinense ZZ0214-1]
MVNPDVLDILDYDMILQCFNDPLALDKKWSEDDKAVSRGTYLCLETSRARCTTTTTWTLSPCARTTRPLRPLARPWSARWINSKARLLLPMGNSPNATRQTPAIAAHKTTVTMWPRPAVLAKCQQRGKV